MLERIFALSAHGTNVRTEALAGATTFLTMAYIIAGEPRDPERGGHAGGGRCGGDVPVGRHRLAS